VFAEEQSALLPLPVEPFRYYQYGERTVHLEECVEVEAAYYSAPPGWIGRQIHVQWNDSQVRLIGQGSGQLLRGHLRQQRGRYRIHEEDLRKEMPPLTYGLLRRGEIAGPHIGVPCQVMYRNQSRTPNGACRYRAPGLDLPPIHAIQKLNQLTVSAMVFR
jgi:hypothetical protein